MRLTSMQSAACMRAAPSKSEAPKICSDAPNMDGVNAAALQNAEVGKEQVALAREQMGKAEARQAGFDPLYKQLIQSSLDAQSQATAQSADQWNRYRTTFAPLESKMAETAANFDTPQRREAEAAAARADVAQSVAGQQEALQRDIGRTGMTLTGGKALALQAGAGLSAAKASAGASGTARRAVEQAGIGLVDNAAKFGRNMPSTGLQSAQLALSAGGQAAGQIGSQQQTINTTYAPAQGFYNGATGATGSAGSMLLGAANVQQQANAANSSLLGSLVGMGGGALLISSSKAKNVEGDVDPDAALSAVTLTPVKAWRYKDGFGDNRLRLGPMAEDVAANTGVGDGQTLDIATELGTLRAAVQALAKDGAKRKATAMVKKQPLALTAD
jgi:hypothetical protein